VGAEQRRGEPGHMRQGGADRVPVGDGPPAPHARRAQRPGGMLRHPLQRGREFECLEHRGRDPTRGTHAADSSSRTIWFTTLPSARPLNWGITCPMTLPTSRAPPAMASRTARRISSGSTAAGRNSSSALTSASSTSARSPRRSEEHTSELQSPYDLVCRLLLEKK